jgi:hypothetical protein
LVGNVFQFWSNYSSDTPWNDYSSFTDAVPNEETALKIAKAVIVAAYGEELMLLHEPYRVKFNESIQTWVVIGAIPLPDGWDIEGPPPLGSAPEITIRKSDGKIMRIVYY